MTATAASPADAAALDPEVERAERHGRWLKALGELGMELAHDLRELARAPEAEPAEIAKAFDRVARCVRLTMALETKLAEDRAARDRADPVKQRAREEAEETARFAATPAAERRRNVLRNVVPDMIEAHHEREYLVGKDEILAESESLIDDELDDETVLNRPLSELIAVVCEALGVEPDWSLWDPGDWTDRDWGVTEAEISAGCPVEKPRRLEFPPPDPEAANDAAERLAAAASRSPP